MTNTIVMADGLFGETGAVFCGTDHDHDHTTYVQQRDCHRYKLWRIWDPTVQPCMFVMLNPSTADHKDLDPTVRRCIGYAQQWGYGGLYVGNLYGIRETDSDEMLKLHNPVGEANLEALAEMAALCPRIVLGWGGKGTHVPGHIERVLAVLREHGPGKVYALKLVGKDKQPGHPLYIPKSASLVEYTK